MPNNNYHCKCGGLILPDFESFKVGDIVNFMVENKKLIGGGKVSVNQTAYKGVISKIEQDDIQVKTPNSSIKCFRYGITPADAPGPIEYGRIGKCRCELDKELHHEN